MNNTPSRVLLHAEGFAVRDELTAHAEEKAGKLLRHSHPRVQLLRFNVKLHTPHSGAPFFAVRAIAENEGPDHIVHADGAEPESAINEAVHKLERALAGSAGARKHDLHRTSSLKTVADNDA
jgi:ribosome-associated translation inhibitor RaiA